MTSLKTYLSLVKFSHTIFAMPFALIGFFLGLFWARFAGASKFVDGWEQALKLFVLVVLCMIFARSAAMAFNRYLDRRFDALNPRTAIREIPSGIITPANALGFTIINGLLFIVAAGFINRLCLILSPLALAIVLGYSYTKRFTSLCHLVLGLGLSLAPIGAYIAVTGRFDILPLMFSAVVLCWVSGFDIIYALQDVEFDRSQNLYSIPSKLGRSKGLVISRVLHIISAALVITAGFYGRFGWLYWVGAAGFTGMLIYQQRLVKPGDLSKVNLAFMTANGIASVVFAIFVIADLFINQ
jgi:4-hydroxybenzoate polyprenyltransferase